MKHGPCLLARAAPKPSLPILCAPRIACLCTLTHLMSLQACCDYGLESGCSLWILALAWAGLVWQEEVPSTPYVAL